MIIKSLLDTDLYKFTMMQVVLHQFPGASAEYRFKCRNNGAGIMPFADEIRQEIKNFCSLTFQEEELNYLRSLAYIKDDFVDFLRLFKANEDFIEVKINQDFEIIIRGPWLHTILFEVPVLSIVNEVFFRNTQPDPDYAEGERRLQEKIAFVQQAGVGEEFKFSDFGSRRRFSRDWQRHVVTCLRDQLPQNITGTSNVLLAKELQMKPIGTMAHEYIQACQSLGPRLLYSQKFAFEKWAQEYRGDLGIALSDTYSLQAFIHDFDLYFCKLFDGARQDSGDPITWGDAVIAHYENMRVDPKTKVLVFSDNLNFPKAIEIFRHFHERSNCAFGIGTNLTNDLGYKTLDIVIKMTECNGQPVAKISDTPEKTMCRDQSYFNYLKHVFNIK